MLSLLFVGAVAFSFGQGQTGGGNSNADYTCVAYAGAMTLSVPTDLTVSRTGTKSFIWHMKDFDVFQDIEGQGFVSRTNTKAEYGVNLGTGLHPGIALGFYDPDANDIELLTGYEKNARIVTTDAEPGFYTVYFSYSDFGTDAGADPTPIYQNMGITIN